MKVFTRYASVVWLVMATAVVVGQETKKEDLKAIQPEVAKLGRPVDFEKDIYPILDANCIACHNLAIAESKLNLEEVATILKGGKRGPGLVAKDPEKSLLYQVASRGKQPVMPPIPNKVEASALTPKELGLLRQWIMEGASVGDGATVDSVQWNTLSNDLKAIYSVAVSEWGRFTAAGRTNQIDVYEVGTGRHVARLNDPALQAIKIDGKPMYAGGAAHRDFVHALAFNPQQNLLASAGYRVVKLWKRPDNAQKAKIDIGVDSNAIALSADGNLMAVAGVDNVVHVWNNKAGKAAKLQGHKAPVTGVAFWPAPVDKYKVEKANGDAQTALRTAFDNLQTAQVNLERFNPKAKKLDAEQEKVEREKLQAAVTATMAALKTAKTNADAATKAVGEFAKQVADSTFLVSVSTDKTFRVWKTDGSLLGELETPAPITAVALNGDGTQVVTGHADNLIRSWARPDGKPVAKKDPADPAKKEGEKVEGPKPIKELKGHTKPISSLQLLASTGTQVVSGSEDGTARTWDLNSGNAVRTFAFGVPITGVTASSDGLRIAASANNGTARLWNAANGQQIAELKGDLVVGRDVIGRTDTKTVADEQFKDADAKLKAADKDVKDREAAEKKAQEAKTAADKAVIEPEKKSKAADEVLAKAKDELNKLTAEIVELTKKSTDAEKADVAVQAELKKAKDAQTAANTAATNAAKTLVTANTNKTNADKVVTDAEAKLKAADETLKKAKDELAKKTDDAGLKKKVEDAQKAVVAAQAELKTAKDAQTAAAKAATDATQADTVAKLAKTNADKAATDADTKAKTSAATLKTAKDELAKKTSGDAAAKKKVVDEQKKADGAKAELKKVTDAQAASVRSAELAVKAVAKAKTELTETTALKAATEATQKQATADLEAGKKKEAEPGKALLGIAFAMDGDTIATVGADNLVRLWDGKTGTQLETLAGHTAAPKTVAFDADTSLVTAAADKSVVIWDSNPEWQLIATIGTSKEAPLDISKSPFVSRVISLDFSDDGKLLATGGGDPSRSGEVILFDVEKLSILRKIEDAHSDTVFDLEFSRDGKLLVSGAADKFVKIHDVATGKHVRSFEGHTHHVMGVGWQANGFSIASAGADNAIKVWNVETGEQRRTISNYSKQVTSLQFIGVTENILTCGGDNSVQSHRTSNGSRLKTFGGGTDYMYSAAATRDNAVVAAGGEDGVLRVWNANAQAIGTFAAPKNPVTDADLVAANAQVTSK
ncbi:MAG: hypothetical protein O3A00_17035 [Planctomycetota bacterium]|nr:hypothetical protein [Planctomycetota bacterium]